jgi:preprotein translocase subunit SecA
MMAGVKEEASPTSSTSAVTSSGVQQREDGTTVRRISEGGTYTKGDDEFAEVGRNDPCPCGSGKKFKKCHGA